MTSEPADSAGIVVFRPAGRGFGPPVDGARGVVPLAWPGFRVMTEPGT